MWIKLYYSLLSCDIEILKTVELTWQILIWMPKSHENITPTHVFFRTRSYTFKICAIVFDQNSIYLKNTLNHKLYTFILNYILNIFITLNLKTYRKKLWKLFQVREFLLVIMHLRARTILSFVFMLINAWYIETFLCIEIFLSSWNYFSETRICYPLCVNHFWI